MNIHVFQVKCLHLFKTDNLRILGYYIKAISSIDDFISNVSVTLIGKVMLVSTIVVINSSLCASMSSLEQLLSKADCKVFENNIFISSKKMYEKREKYQKLDMTTMLLVKPSIESSI